MYDDHKFPIVALTKNKEVEDLIEDVRASLSIKKNPNKK